MNVQPLSLPTPTVEVQVANNAAAYIGVAVTNTALISTAPKRILPRQSRVPQLPSYVTNALISQQAMTNSSLSLAEKIKYGVLPGPTGVTLQQLSAPGQSIKPGAGQFLQQLQQQAPGLNFDKLASNTVLTGNFGVTTPQNLIKNVTAQLGATTNSFVSSTIGLAKNNIIKGIESPTQVAGVILAGATLGVKKVTEILNAPAAIAAKVTDTVNNFGKLVSGGNLAASLADKLSSGVTGLTSSINGLASGLTSGLTNSISGITSGLTASLGGLTSNITGALGGLTGAFGGIAGALGGLFGGGSKRTVQIPSVPLLKSFIPGLVGQAQQAYQIAETSFGKLSANKPNALGGAKLTTETDLASNSLRLIRQIDKARQDLTNAESELLQASRAYRVEESAETYESLLSAQSARASAVQKLSQLEQTINTVGQNSTAVSAQAATTVANAAASGLIDSPNTKNSGINSLPGGIAALTAQVTGASTNIINSFKGLADKISTTANTVVDVIKDPSKLVGNLLGNVQDKLGTLVSGPIGVVNSIKDKLSGFMSGISSTLSSLGSAPGQIKAAILATNTFDAGPTVTAKVGSVLNDTRIPVPVFEETPNVKVDNATQEQQYTAQIQLENLYAERELLSYNLSVKTIEYSETQQASLLSGISALTKQISEIDIKIVAAQANYDRIVNNK